MDHPQEPFTYPEHLRPLSDDDSYRELNRVRNLAAKRLGKTPAGRDRATRAIRSGQPRPATVGLATVVAFIVLFAGAVIIGAGLELGGGVMASWIYGVAE